MSDDEPITLSSSTLSALQEFYTDRDERTQQFQALKSRASDEFDRDGEDITMDAFTEDWNASQFWYDDATATTLAKQLLDGADNTTRIAIVSAPSVYVAMRPLLKQMEASKRPVVKILEFDERFGVFKRDFVFYDYRQPLKLDDELKGSFDRIACDPPFLNEDCQTKASLTVRWLARDWPGVKYTLCTGERMETLAHRLYAKIGLKTTTFRPCHSKGLSNEFRCYSNFECDNWKFEDQPE